MKIETLERLWRDHDRDPDRTAQACLLEDMTTTIDRRRNGQTLFFLCVSAVLGTITLVFGYDVVRHEGFNATREWAALLMLAAPWAALILMKRAHDRHIWRFPDPGASIPETLRVRLDENHAAQQNAIVMFWLIGLFPVVTGAALWQLIGTDKMSAAQALQGALLFGGVLGVSTVIQVLRYRRVLRPEGEALTRLLAEYEN